MPFKPFVPALIFSLAVHAAAGFSFYSISAHHGAKGAQLLNVSRSGNRGVSGEKNIEITMVAPPPKQEPQKTALTGDVKVYPKARAAHKIRPHVQRAPAKAVSAVSGNAVRESAELLADPQVGKVFSDYFLKIKEQIHQTAKKSYSSGTSERGKTTLVFILRSDGSLDHVGVADDRSDADSEAKKFAIDCVKKASPFPAFPKELNLSKISFSISVVFENL